MYVRVRVVSCMCVSYGSCVYVYVGVRLTGHDYPSSRLSLSKPPVMGPDSRMYTGTLTPVTEPLSLMSIAFHPTKVLPDTM